MARWILDARLGHALAFAFAAYAIGVIASAYSLGWPAAFCFVALLSSAAVVRRTDAVKRAAVELTIIVAIAGVAGFCLGARAGWARLHPPFAALQERHVAVEAVALERPKPTSSGVSFRIRIKSIDAPRGAPADSLVGRVALLEAPSLQNGSAIAGRSMIVKGRVELPGGPRNDGEPAQRDVLAEQGVELVVAVPAARDLRLEGPASGVEAWLARLRARFADAIEGRLPALDATVLEGVLWGDRSDLPAALRQEFSDTGTVHVLTTAGLHLGIMTALLMRLLATVPLPRVARMALVICAAWSYAALAGLHLPTIRAAAMLTAGIAAYESGRGRSPSPVLAAAAFAVALPQPLAVLSPSFSLSFACVAGIALLSPALERLGMRAESGIERHVCELARTSLVVQIALWPLQALYFNVFTPYAVVANLLVVPIIGVIMACGATFVALALVAPWASTPFANLAWWGVSAVTAIVDRTSSLPGAHVDVPPPSQTFLVLYWIALAAFALAVKFGIEKRRLVCGAIAAGAVLAIVYCAPGFAAALDPRMHLDAIDVGQADCLLVRAPGMHAMLVDGGGKLERAGVSGQIVAQPIGDVIATKTVMPFLLRHWITHLDVVVLTHPHGDHAGGLPVILARERVGAVYDSAQLYGGQAYRRALAVTRERHIPWRRAVRGVAFNLGPTTHVRVLGPELPLLTGTASDINNNSVVLRVEFGRTSILMTGDAQSEAEARLLSHGEADLSADILKVGHHGSAYSSTPAFLAAVRPKIAIISCGLHNVFGHPSPRTLAALRAAGAIVYRTDLDGGITVEAGGAEITTKLALHG
jgi:competence protein ComEC